MRDRAAASGRVAYVLKGHPRLSEVFITSEIFRLEQLGVPLRLYVLNAADEEVQHDVVRRLRVRPEYLQPTTSLSASGLYRWLGANLGRFRAALLRTARRHPVGLAHAAVQAVAQAVRARRSFLASPRKLYFKEFLLAVDLADRLDTAGDVRRLHAHFAHGTTTVTWLASTITGLPFSFTGHAKDIWTEERNPAGLLRRKLDAASFVVTCTEANHTHLVSTPTSNRSSGRVCAGPTRRGSACSRWGGWSARRAWTPSWTPARCCVTAVWTSTPSSSVSPAITSRRFVPGWTRPGWRDA